MSSITHELRMYANMVSRVLIGDRDELLAIADRIDAELVERYVELPLDADGEHIHMGDRMENGELVARIVLTDGSWEPTVHTAATPNQLHEFYCHDVRHYHEPTVEDLLREFTHAILNQKACYREQNIAQYAAKLRLAEGVDG